MKNQKDLNHVGEKIIETLREKFPNDEFYIQEKIDRLAMMPNKHDTFHWALCQLDECNLFALFEKLGIDKRGYNFYNHLFKCL